MANINRLVGQNAYTVQAPVVANVKIEIGDLVYAASAISTVPASGLTWLTNADGTAGLAQASFLGVSQDQHLDTQSSGTINVATDGFFRYPSSGVTAAAKIGTKVGPIKDSAGNYLANQLLTTTTSTTGCIRVLAGKLPIAAANNESLKVRIFGVSSRDV